MAFTMTPSSRDAAVLVLAYLNVFAVSGQPAHPRPPAYQAGQLTGWLGGGSMIKARRCRRFGDRANYTCALLTSSTVTSLPTQAGAARLLQVAKGTLHYWLEGGTRG